MGFTECVNQPSVYYHAERQIWTSCHIDDPLTICKRDVDGVCHRDWFYKTLGDRFKIKDVRILTPETELDYISIRIRTDALGNFTLDNDEYVRRVIEDAGMTGCNVTKRPMCKDHLKIVSQEADDGEFVDVDGKKMHQHLVGEFNWLAQTTHPGIAVATSMMGKYNSAPTPTCLRWTSRS